MQFIPVLETFPQDTEATVVWERISSVLGAVEGLCFYKHPALGAVSPEDAPDFAILAAGFPPFVVRCVRVALDDIKQVDEDAWLLRDTRVDSPALELDDLVENLRHRFDRERPLRGKLHPKGVLAFPYIKGRDFEARFGEIAGPLCLWSDSDPASVLTRSTVILDDEEWRLARSVFQAASVLSHKAAIHAARTAHTLGDAIRLLEKRIALLDEQQLRAAIQIAPGPQRIRGLAGTGKTVLLAMKAATIHGLYPRKRILFTFHTQSLYNQAQRLITRFYRVSHEVDPDWDFLHVRHAWGARYRPGVYSELAERQGERPLNFNQAREEDNQTPFRACCKHVLLGTVVPEYDYVLVDEGQDLPLEFFQVLYRLSKEPHRIYLAYDELQSLSSVELPSSSALFGVDEDGQPLVSFEGEYPGPMEKDLVLNRSYRCPRDVLMVAHAIGLGFKGPRGAVQMLSDRASWEAIGYLVERGPLRAGVGVEILRPPESSPNPIQEIYAGREAFVSSIALRDRDEEIAWAVQSIAKDIEEEGVRPEEIIVVWFDAIRSRKFLPLIQQGLLRRGIQSTLPGILHGTADFAEPGRVTLTTAYRAKGNESPVVYLLAADVLHSFAGEIEYRNRAFTSISRSKGWVRIVGSGVKMASLQLEVQAIQADIPYFRFVFPDMEEIRRLDARETTRRRKKVQQARKSVEDLLAIDPGALEDLDPSALAELEVRLRQIRGGQGEAE